MAFIPRIYVGSDRIADGKAYIDGSDANHILRVLRKEKGDTLHICDMHGNSYKAVIDEITGDGLFAVLGEPEKQNNEMPFKVSVYQCFPKGDKLETVIQKAVELGAYEIIAVMSERCVARPDGKAFAKRIERLKKISESAAAQCGRNIIPEIRGIITYDQAIEEISQKDIGFICYEGDGTRPIKELLTETPETIGFLIGPEGGLSEKETAKAKEKNISLSGLGKRILRTETASSYVLSAISVLLEM